MPNLWVTNHLFEFDDERIVLPENLLHFIAAGFKNETLTLCVAEFRPLTAGGTHREPDSVHQFVTTLRKQKDRSRQIAATRALRAVSTVIEKAPAEAIAEAASASSDLGVLVRTLQQPDAIAALRTDDPLGPARLRGLKERERLLSVEGGTWTAEEAASHLDVTRQAVNKRRQQGALVGLDAGRHGYLYPVWQFVREGTLAGLEGVLDALNKHDPWMQHVFMVSRNTRLKDLTPLEALRGGRLEDVLKAARALGEHGAA